MSNARKVHSTYKYVGGKRLTVWLVRDPIDVNGVLGHLRPTDQNELQLVPTPPPFNLSFFEPGDNTYGVIEAGCNCPKCKAYCGWASKKKSLASWPKHDGLKGQRSCGYITASRSPTRGRRNRRRSNRILPSPNPLAHP